MSKPRRRLTAIKHFGQWALVLKKDPCVYCGRVPRIQCVRAKPRWVGKGTIEHIRPRHETASKMERNSWENLAGACSKCNQACRRRQARRNRVHQSRRVKFV